MRIDGLQDFELVVDQLGHRVHAQLLEDLAELLDDELGVVAAGREAERRHLVHLQVVDLRHGDVVARLQPLLDRLDDAPLVLERPAAAQAQGELEHTDFDLTQPIASSRSSRTTSNDSSTSPTLTSSKLASLRPHSKPSLTSRTSSLKRLSDSRPVV